MQENTLFPAAEKILFDIENILKKDKNLHSFEIIPINDNENKSPVYHEQNALGLASWCVQPLYCYTYNRLIELRGNKFRREDPCTASRWLLGAILINPDVSTFWNMRRELVRNGRLDAFEELRFTRIVLYHKAKCFEAFAYRRWLVEFLLMESEYLNVNVETLLATEISIAITSADRYASNYHAWSHREYAVTTHEALAPSSFASLLFSEWESSKKWCSQHVSDHSGLAYRQLLLQRLILFDRQPTESGFTFTPDQLFKRREIVFSYIKSGARGIDVSFLYNRTNCDSELLDCLHGKKKSEINDVNYEQVMMALSYWIEDCCVNEDLINCYSGHESLWYHRRFLAYSLRCLEISYSKYSSYKSEFFEPRYCLRDDNQDEIEGLPKSKSLLEIAFRGHNEEIFSLVRQKDDHSINIVENFVKFLASMDL